MSDMTHTAEFLVSYDLLREVMQMPEGTQVLSVRAGKKIEPFCEWPFFLAVEFDSRDKQAIGLDDPHWLKFIHDVMGPHAAEELTLTYELEPGRDIRYS